MFQGCQPQSLQHNDLQRLLSQNYYVMDKTDGVRYQLFGLPSSDRRIQCYLVDRWMHIQLAGLVIQLKETSLLAVTGFLIDGELLKDGRYMAFDVLWAGGTDKRVRLTHQRLECLQELVNEINVSKIIGNQRIKVAMKKYVNWSR